jgi:hypothetical protein
MVGGRISRFERGEIRWTQTGGPKAVFPRSSTTEGETTIANFLTKIISPPKRKAVYGIYSVVGLAIGATQAGFSAVEAGTLTG